MSYSVLKSNFCPTIRFSEQRRRSHGFRGELSKGRGEGGVLVLGQPFVAHALSVWRWFFQRGNLIAEDCGILSAFLRWFFCYCFFFLCFVFWPKLNGSGRRWVKTTFESSEKQLNPRRQWPKWITTGAVIPATVPKLRLRLGLRGPPGEISFPGS